MTLSSSFKDDHINVVTVFLDLSSNALSLIFIVLDASDWHSENGGIDLVGFEMWDGFLLCIPEE